MQRSFEMRAVVVGTGCHGEKILIVAMGTEKFAMKTIVVRTGCHGDRMLLPWGKNNAKA